MGNHFLTPIFHARIQEFSSGRVQVSLFFFFFFFSPQLILQKSNGQYQRNLSFFKVPEGVQHFPGGVQLFPGGSNCLFPIETHITCDFPGGVWTPCPPPPPPPPPLDLHLYTIHWVLLNIIMLNIISLIINLLFYHLFM